MKLKIAGAALIVLGGLVWLDASRGLLYTSGSGGEPPEIANFVGGFRTLALFVVAVGVLMLFASLYLPRHDSGVDTEARNMAAGEGGSRLCPFCAEEIKPAAVVCRHCGRDLPEAMHATQLPDASAGPTSDTEVTTPGDLSVAERDKMEALGISFDGSHFHYDRYRYEHLDDAIAYAELQSEPRA